MQKRRITKRRRRWVAKGGTKSIDFTFGIVTDGSADDRILLMFDSIRSQKIPKYEIIIVGNSKLIAPDLTVFEFDESKYPPSYERLGIPPHSIKKNMIAEKAKYENVVIMHDYIILDNNWYSGFLKYGNNFDVCKCPIITVDGRNVSNNNLMPKTCVLSKLESVHNFSLPHEFKMTPLISKITYVNGKFYVIKKRVAMEHPLHEVRPDADLVHSVQLSNANIVMQHNVNSSIRLLKEKYLEGEPLTQEQLERLNKLTEAEILEIFEELKREYGVYFTK